MDELIKLLETAAADFRRMSEVYLEQAATFERYAAEFKRIGKPRIRIVAGSSKTEEKDNGQEY